MLVNGELNDSYEGGECWEGIGLKIMLLDSANTASTFWVF